MECPTCRRDLSGFKYIYKFCPLCNSAFPEEIPAGRSGSPGREERQETRADVESVPDDPVPGTVPDSPFEIYWKEEAYRQKRSNTLEIDLVPGEELKNLSVKVKVPSLDLVIERDALPRIEKKTRMYFTFKPETAGRHAGRLTVLFHDIKGNPTVFDTEDFVFTVDEAEEGETHTTYNIGDIFSTAAVSLGASKPRTADALRNEEPRMIMLEPLYNDMETRRIRREMLIGRLMTEGGRFFEEGRDLIEAVRDRKSGDNEVPLGGLDLLSKARERFMHVRQEDPDHEESLHFIEKIREMLGRPGMEKARKKEKTCHGRFDSCTLRIVRHGMTRKVFLFSKENIWIGAGESNDIAIPEIEYISNAHAVIKVNRLGEFFVRDTGTDGLGSRNGTFLNGNGKRITPGKDYPLHDGTILNLGRSLGLFCRFLWGPGKDRPDRRGTPSGCFTVTGEHSDTCFGIDKWGIINAMTVKSGNPVVRDEYIILMREITAGTRSTNAVILKGENISDIHMKISFRDGLYAVEDLNSLHGTFVNEYRLDPGVEYPLSEAAVITVGDTAIHFEVKHPSA